MVGEKPVEEIEELSAVAETGQLIGDRLAGGASRSATSAAATESPSRTPTASQGGRGKPDRDRGDCVDRVDEEDCEPCGGAEAGQGGTPTSRSASGLSGRGAATPRWR